MPLGAGASKEDYIRDFLESDAPQFKGKSKKKRVQMALAAYYSKNLKKAAPRPLFVARYLHNAKDLIKWARGEGFSTTVPADDLHVTICYSRAPVDWMKADESWGYGSDEGLLKVTPGGPRVVERLGDKGAVVLLFKCRELSWRHDSIRNTTGASWDYQSYQPHVTITYNGGAVDLSEVEPYTGELVFGPEIFATLDNTYVDNIVEKRLYSFLAKEGGNPYHKPAGPGGGQFTTGSGAGGGGVKRHTASAIAGGVTGATVGHATGDVVDWFFAHTIEGNKQFDPEGKEIKNANVEVAKRITKALIGVGVDLAATSVYGKLIQAALPLLHGPGKHVAVAAATTMIDKFGPALKASVPGAKVAMIKAIQSMHALGLGKALPFEKDDEEEKKPVKAVNASVEDEELPDKELVEEDTDDVDEELVDAQIARLLAVLQDIDGSDMSVTNAKDLLKEEAPEVLERITTETAEFGENDYHSIVQEAKDNYHPVLPDRTAEIQAEIDQADEGGEVALEGEDEDEDEEESKKPNPFAGKDADEEDEEDDKDNARVVKVDKRLGLVFGWAVVCKQNGKDYYDLNIDHNGERVPEHIPEGSMLKAAMSFMENHRVVKEMHGGDQQGTVVFAFPMTTDIAKALGIETKTTGLLIAMKPGPEMLDKFASGELKGFSIGGSRVKAREITEEAA